jgi:hypothetical protein
MYQASIRRAAGVRSTAPGPCEAAQHVRASVVSVPTVLAGHQLGSPPPTVRNLVPSATCRRALPWRAVLSRRRSRLVTPGPRTPCASGSKQIPAATGSTALPSRRAFSANSLISSAPLTVRTDHRAPNRLGHHPSRMMAKRPSTSRASDPPKTGKGSQTDPGPVLTPLGTDSHPSAEGPPGRGLRRRRRPQAGRLTRLSTLRGHGRRRSRCDAGDRAGVWCYPCRPVSPRVLGHC